jgi:hypothetical protein
MEPLQVGDLCVTQNTVVSGLNNGLLVVIIAINPWCNEGTTPYRIRRVDGQPIPSIRQTTGESVFFKGKECWSAGYKLRRIDPDSRSNALIRSAELQS